MDLRVAGRSAFRLRYVKWWMRTPWRYTWRRLFGTDQYLSSVECGGWEYTPLFRLRRTGMLLGATVVRP
jgi:hypothetical protein